VLDALKEFELIDERFFFPAPGCRDDIKSMDDFTYCLWCFEMRKK
jgi:hypothetical protein